MGRVCYALLTLVGVFRLATVVRALSQDSGGASRAARNRLAALLCALLTSVFWFVRFLDLRTAEGLLSEPVAHAMELAGGIAIVHSGVFTLRIFLGLHARFAPKSRVLVYWDLLAVAHAVVSSALLAVYLASPSPVQYAVIATPFSATQAIVGMVGVWGVPTYVLVLLRGVSVATEEEQRHRRFVEITVRLVLAVGTVVVALIATTLVVHIEANLLALLFLVLDVLFIGGGFALLGRVARQQNRRIGTAAAEDGTQDRYTAQP